MNAKLLSLVAAAGLLAASTAIGHAQSSTQRGGSNMSAGQMGDHDTGSTGQRMGQPGDRDDMQRGDRDDMKRGDRDEMKGQRTGQRDRDDMPGQRTGQTRDRDDMSKGSQGMGRSNEGMGGDRDRR